MFRVIEISLADAHRLLEYKRTGVFGAGFSLKGFDYPWILSSRDWQPGDKVLDVGSGYSDLPIHLADVYGCEVWAVDDFGLASDEPFWTRGRDPEEHIRKHPQVRYMLERLGDLNNSNLPVSYFDCVISASTLEHLPGSQIRPVWEHIDKLLKPAGEAIHAIDMKIPVHRGLISLVKGLLLDACYHVLPRDYRAANIYYTPKTYIRSMSQILDFKPSPHNRSLGLVRSALDPSIVVEPLDWAYNRIVKDGLKNVPILRVVSLLIHLRKRI
jgi:SAM-dependent methyltransferase